jgi:hypothetical protein
MNPEYIGVRNNDSFTIILKERFIKALSEKNITNVKIENIPQTYAIFPRSFYNNIKDETKTIDFNFHGSIGQNKYQAINRAWVFDFISKYFTKDSFFVNTILKENHIPIGIFDHSDKFGSLTWITTKVRAIYDPNYFSTLRKSKFCLCPAGDYPWSIRFYEALMCKAIPIVKYSWETWRSLEESKLDYKFYFADDKEFIYNEDWAEHNYALFMKYHTLDGNTGETTNKVKCARKECVFLKHSQNIGDGRYCCKACKTSGAHGPRCERNS